MHDNCASDDAVRSRVQRDAADFGVIDRDAVRVRCQVAQIARVAMRRVWPGVSLLVRIEVSPGAGGIGRGAIAFLVYVEAVQPRR